ncbi:L domain-like protein [Neolentinus lepideus HHB14362 ss-1]|uniref:L domain-like protein n=1 Tax=Neolentinus lepideus HHB14362 ss-1 TaxID=1314782 RepID=A0A165QIZ2_9AGAM|nr:L domain-like protein [Neolentinus lepideus HHB14362 ss-1]
MTTKPQSSYNFRSSWKPASKFREHLSVDVPIDDAPIQHSRFSAESSPPSFRTASAATMNDSHPGSKVRDIEAQSQRSGFRNRLTHRFTNLFFDLRVLGKEPEIVPIQPPQLPDWPPLKVEDKLVRCACEQRHERNRKRIRIWLIILIIVLLFLFFNTVFLNVRVVRLSSAPPGPLATSITSTNSSSSPNTLSVDAQQCISQYTLDAPASPSSYPCSSCLPVLQSVPSGLSSTDPSDMQQVLNAIQFCGLKGIFDDSDSTAQTALHNQGWLNDTRFCAWNSVTCDGAGRVSSLQLTFPSVPSLFPSELVALTGLQSLSVIGNNAMPAGSLPSSFTNLTLLTTLHLESTALTALPDNLFSSLNKVTTLALIDNAQMGNTLPSSVTQLSLQSLVINGQSLNNPFPSFASSASLQSSLQLLDLSSTNLTASIPASITSFTALKELHLSSDNIQSPLPSSLPQSLQLLTLANNSGLSGTLSGCPSTLQSCSVTGTAVQVGSGCGVCTTSGSG